MHPIMNDETKETMDNMMHSPLDPEGRSFTNLYRLILEDGINELKGDTKFATFFSPFKKLEEKEKKRFADTQS